MRDYVIKRLLLVPITLLGISLITFIVIQLAPGDPAEMKVRPGVGGEQQADKSVNRETYEKTREQFDLDKPKLMQYVRWVGKLCGVKVNVWGAKKSCREDVENLLIAKFEENNSDRVAEQAKRTQEQVVRDVETDIAKTRVRVTSLEDEVANPKSVESLRKAKNELSVATERLEALQAEGAIEAKAKKQLRDWVVAQAKKERFRYSNEIDEIRASYREKYGEEDWEEYFEYAAPSLNLTKDGSWYPLDFGRSFKDDREVIEILKEKIPPSLELSLFSLFFAYMIAIPLGIHSSVSQGTMTDQVVTTTLFVLYSLPSFWIAIMLLLFVSEGGTWVRWFPVGGLWPDMVPGQSKLDPAIIVQHLKHLVLPVFCLTYASFAYLSRQMRAGMLEVVRQDYIRTARAKGIPESKVILKHALRNSLIPIITIVAVILPALVGGSVIIETIFSIDGIGLKSFTAILTRDYPVIMAIFTLSALLTLLGILLSDILYAIVDPNISFEGK